MPNQLVVIDLGVSNSQLLIEQLGASYGYLAVSGGVYVDADDLCRHAIGPLLTTRFYRYGRQQLGRVRLPAGIRVMTEYRLYDFISPHIPYRHKYDERHWNSEQSRSRSLFRRVAAS
jgi:hypothetical protein